MADADRELLELARQAGLLPNNTHPAPETRNLRTKTKAIGCFAALVAAREREECAKVCDGATQEAYSELDAVAWEDGASYCATAIRARSIMANGLTEDETSQTASVAGLTRDRSPKDTQ